MENGLEGKTRGRERRGEAATVICFEIMLAWPKVEAVLMGRSTDLRKFW